MHSAIYEGTIQHRRHIPVHNSFRYRLFMLFLDLDELDEVFDSNRYWSVEKRNFAVFRRSGHLGNPDRPLADSVRQLVKERAGLEISGPIRVLTHLRYFGHCFNPVSFYYCYDPNDENIEAIVLEVHNIPWLQEHCYVLTENLGKQADEWKRYTFRKEFHVSPFMDMDFMYTGRFLTPGASLRVHLQSIKEGRKYFDATLNLSRKEITGSRLSGLLLRYPLMTVQVVSKIYWQALKLKFKGARYYPNLSIKKDFADG
jgi:DUF1365 family protein